MKIHSNEAINIQATVPGANTRLSVSPLVGTTVQILPGTEQNAQTDRRAGVLYR